MIAASAMAPVRLDLAGGWTDVPPFSAREGGVVVNAAISLFARADARRSPVWRVAARELGAEAELERHDTPVDDPRLLLHTAALRLVAPAQPVELVSSADFPAGAGLGGSGALDAALAAALELLEGRPVTPERIAHLGWQLEAIEAGVPGGRQDQYASAFGGFNQMSFNDPDVRVNPIAIDREFAAELARSTILCYTGASRLSGNTIARVMNAYAAGEPGVTDALRELKELAHEMRSALEAADLGSVGRIMSRNWAAQQQLDPAMATPGMVELERAMIDAGAIGGKAAGSGAGGCMFFVVPGDREKAEQEATARGAQLLPVRWAWEGVRSC